MILKVVLKGERALVVVELYRCSNPKTGWSLYPLCVSCKLLSLGSLVRQCPQAILAFIFYHIDFTFNLSFMLQRI